MKRSIKLSNLKGIVFNMHWTFLILLVWIIAANAVTGTTINNIIWSLIFIVLVFLSIAVHEMGNYWAAKQFKIQTNEITLLPIGAISYFENFPKSFKEELLINMTGPAINLAIAGLLLPFIQSHPPVWEITSHFDIIHENDLLYKLHLVNLGLFAVNLVPAFPMKGGRIMRALLGLRMNYFKATSVVVIIGKIIAIISVAAGIIYLDLLLVLLGVLIFLAVRAEEYILHLRSLVKGVTFSDVVINDYHSLQANNTVHEAMNTLMGNLAKYFMVMENGRPVGTIDRMHIINEVAEKNYTLSVKSLMKANLVYFHADAGVEEEFKTLVAFPFTTYPVMQDNRFLGVVSLLSILEYLMLHQLTSKEREKLKGLIKKI